MASHHQNGICSLVLASYFRFGRLSFLLQSDLFLSRSLLAFGFHVAVTGWSWLWSPLSQECHLLIPFMSSYPQP